MELTDEHLLEGRTRINYFNIYFYAFRSVEAHKPFGIGKTFYITLEFPNIIFYFYLGNTIYQCQISIFIFGKPFTSVWNFPSSCFYFYLGNTIYISLDIPNVMFLFLSWEYRKYSVYKFTPDSFFVISRLGIGYIG